jgi:glycosyltransferase involved in cell wall biosynthesis
LLAIQYGFDFFFFDNVGKTREDIKHLAIYKEGERFYTLPLMKILGKLFQNKYGVIIKCTNNKWAFFASFFTAKILKAKFIVWHTIWYYPQTLQYRIFSWLLVKILRDHSDAIVVYGEHGKKFLMGKGIESDKIFIAWQTVDNDIFGKEVTEEEINKIRKSFNIARNKKVILYVGRLVEMKGITYLLEALNKLDKNTFVFVAVGSGELRGLMEHYCEKHNIFCQFTGNVPFNDLPPYYKMGTVLILPSITMKNFKEPWGLVVNEAFNQGCPAIITDTVGAGAGGLLVDGFNGFVVPEKNSDALAAALRKIITDENLQKTMSENARVAIQSWTYEKQAVGFVNAVKYAFRGDVRESS